MILFTLMEDLKKNQNSEFEQIEDAESFLEDVIKKRLSQKKAKAKIWEKVISQHKEFILKSLQEGVSKADIHYALNELVKKQYGKAYMIKANYFYMLLKKFLGDDLSSFLGKNNVNVNKKEEKSDKNKTVFKNPLDEYNEGGIV